MIKFRKINIKDKEWIDKYVADGNTNGSSYSFGSLFCWGDSYDLEIAEYDSMLLIRGKDNFGRYYAYPSGKGDIKAAVNSMIDICRQDGDVFRFVQLLEENKKEIDALFPNMFSFNYERDYSEYVYSVENMTNLSGKKFHGKKGHVNAFFKKHEDISCDPITDDNIHYCMDIAKSWLSERQEDEELIAEYNAIKKAVDNYNEINYVGAILFADGKAVAFTMGEPVKNNTFCTHFEKTSPDYRDAYPVINNGFTKLMLNNYKYVNREEDLGYEGLRKAKLSYQPEFLLDKYSAYLKKDTLRKYRTDIEDVEQLKDLWIKVFDDDKKTVDYFFDNTVDINNVYSYKKNDKIVSAFYLIDTCIKKGSTELNGKYLFAAATLPEYRKMGIMSEMIKYAVNYNQALGVDCIFLYPANEELYSFYKKLGFEEKFFTRVYEINSSELEQYRNQRYFNTAVSYYDIRQNVVAENYVDFSVSYLDFVGFCSKNGGFNKSVIFDDEDKVFIIGHDDNDVLYIDEAFSSEYNIRHILGVLADLNYKKIVLSTPVDLLIDGFDSVVRASGMMNMFADDEQQYYLGQPCM